MTGQHGAPAQPAQPVQRLQIVGQAAVFVVDDGGSAAQHGVRGQHRIVEDERQRVGGVAGGRHHRDPQARRVDHLAVGQLAAEAAQESAARRAHRRAGRVDQLVDGVGVVAVPVADQHQRDAAQRGKLRDVLVVVGPGIDDHQLVAARATQHPGVGALQRHQAGIVGQQHRRGIGDRPQPAVSGMRQRLSGLGYSDIGVTRPRPPTRPPPGRPAAVRIRRPPSGHARRCRRTPRRADRRRR